jgi:hypothetical protein
MDILVRAITVDFKKMCVGTGGLGPGPMADHPDPTARV